MSGSFLVLQRRFYVETSEWNDALSVISMLIPDIQQLGTTERMVIEPYWKTPQRLGVVLELIPEGSLGSALSRIKSIFGPGWESSSSPDDVWAVWNLPTGDQPKIPRVRWAHLAVVNRPDTQIPDTRQP